MWDPPLFPLLPPSSSRTVRMFHLAVILFQGPPFPTLAWGQQLAHLDTSDGAAGARTLATAAGARTQRRRQRRWRCRGGRRIARTAAATRTRLAHRCRTERGWPRPARGHCPRRRLARHGHEAGEGRAARGCLLRSRGSWPHGSLGASGSTRHGEVCKRSAPQLAPRGLALQVSLSST